MATLSRLDSSDADFDAKLSTLLAFDAEQDEAIDLAAASILKQVCSQGDAALVRLTREFDRVQVNHAAELEIPRSDWLTALAQLPKAQREALEAAAERGISVVEGIGDPVAPAELTWALILAASRKVPHYAGLLKQGLWQSASIHARHNT